MVLSQFLENFYNDVAIKAHQLIWIPFRLYEEKYINKKDFIEAFNKSFQVIWQDFGDNPKMLEFISGIFFDFAKNLDCLYEDLNVSQVELDENEEMSDFYGNFLKKSLDLLLNNQVI